jgi:hypothetical protein
MEDLTAIAQQLELDAQAGRIKKLLLYATAGSWESNSEKLRQRGITPMLMQLVQLYPTHQQLRFYLHTIVTNLTKPIEYQQLADAVLLKCHGLYPADSDDEDEPTAFFSSQPIAQAPLPDANSLYQQQQRIAQAIELRCDRDRTVKLLICLTRNHWESDPQKIAEASIRELIDQVWRQFPLLDEVERSLFAIVQRLSKAVEYSLVATGMIQQLAPLYCNSYQLNENATDRADIPAPALVRPPLPLVQSIHGFDLRWELMKFANPLRAKILLFSVLHQPFDASDASWSALKRYSLESLLKNLLDRYPTGEIGKRLEQAAHYLPQAEEYAAVIDVLRRSLRLPSPTSPTMLPFPIVPHGDDGDDDGDETEIRLSPVIVSV